MKIIETYTEIVTTLKSFEEIMAEQTNVKKVIDYLEKHGIRVMTEHGYYRDTYDILKDISECWEQLKVDAVKVIRCKDCKHYQEWDDGNPPTCRMWTDQCDMPTEPNGYCHYGELKV